MRSSDRDARPRRLVMYTARHLETLPQLMRLSPEDRFAMRVVASVLPFKTNNHVVEDLIDWEAVPDDPMFRLTFPHRDMLRPDDFDRVARLLRRGAPDAEVRRAADEIRRGLNPHPAGQVEHNAPVLHGRRLSGMQHKYPETLLVFPSAGQTCHAYCTFCFRWPQFTSLTDLKFAARDVEDTLAYLRAHPEITDVLFTGGDPLIMKTHVLRAYIDPILEVPTVRTIRIGSKALAYWPYRFTTDDDADDLLRLFEHIVARGRHLAYMAHFNHPREMKPPAVAEAVRRILATGAQIRTQAPVVRHVNDDPQAWASMWQRQVEMGMIPYYMFVERDTGARHYFEIPLVETWEIFRAAWQRVSGLARTVRGPVMSALPGKVRVDGVARVTGQKVFVLSFLQGRQSDWVRRPFFARFDPKASWLSDLKPAFGEREFFFEPELREILRRRQEEAEVA